MHTQNPSSDAVEIPHTEGAERYVPLTTNFSTNPSLFIDTHVAQRDLQECATIRIQAATDLLESMTCMSISNCCDQDLLRVVNAAYFLLRDGVDLIGLANDKTSANSRAMT